jgi:hypothetical protein
MTCQCIWIITGIIRHVSIGGAVTVYPSWALHMSISGIHVAQYLGSCVVCHLSFFLRLLNCLPLFDYSLQLLPTILKRRKTLYNYQTRNKGRKHYMTGRQKQIKKLRHQEERNLAKRLMLHVPLLVVSNSWWILDEKYESINRFIYITLAGISKIHWESQI